MKTILINASSVFRILLGLLAAILIATPAAAQYPDRPLKLIVGSTSGGPSDIIGRLVGQLLSERLGQPVLIDNRPGAGGTLAAALVAKAPPDGYTLLLTHTGLAAVAPAIYPSLPYDPVKDLAPVGIVTDSPYFLVVPAGSQMTSIADVVTAGRSGAKLNFASAGVGSHSHAIGELFNQMAGTRYTHVPYRGTAPAVVGMLSGETQIFFSTPIEALAHMKAGRLRALATTSPERTPLAPELPTIAEALGNKFDTRIWYALQAPAGTPEAVLKRLHAELSVGLGTPAVKTRLAGLGVVPLVSTAEEMQAEITSDLVKWRKLVKDAGIKPE